MSRENCLSCWRGSVHVALRILTIKLGVEQHVHMQVYILIRLFFAERVCMLCPCLERARVARPNSNGDIFLNPCLQLKEIVFFISMLSNFHSLWKLRPKSLINLLFYFGFAVKSLHRLQKLRNISMMNNQIIIFFLSSEWTNVMKHSSL